MTSEIAKNEYIKQTDIPGLVVVTRPTFRDNRGFFREPIRVSDIEPYVEGGKFEVKQANHSQSNPGVIRGLHAEHWNKIVYPTSGRVFLAIADIREDSGTFGKVQIFEYNTRDELKAIFIPKGLANSLCVVGSEPVDYIYLVDAVYDGKDTRAVAWNDLDLNIPWPIKNPIISDKDNNNPTLRQLFPEKFK